MFVQPGSAFKAANENHYRGKFSSLQYRAHKVWMPSLVMNGVTLDVLDCEVLALPLPEMSFHTLDPFLVPHYLAAKLEMLVDNTYLARDDVASGFARTGKIGAALQEAGILGNGWSYPMPAKDGAIRYLAYNPLILKMALGLASGQGVIIDVADYHGRTDWAIEDFCSELHRVAKKMGFIG